MALNFPTSGLVANVTTYELDGTTYRWDGVRWRPLVIDLDTKQDVIDGIFFVSTTAQRALDPPVGEFGLYSDYNGTPVLEHTQPMVARGIRGVGDGFAIPDSSEGEILYDEWEVVAEGGEGFGTIFGDPNSSTTLSPVNGDVIFERSRGQWWTYVTASNPAETRWVRFTGQHLSDIVDVNPTNLGVDTGLTVSSTEASANGNETIVTASGTFTTPRPAVGQHVLFVDSNEGREFFLIQSVTTNSINILGNYEGKIPAGHAIHVTAAEDRFLTWDPVEQEYQFSEVVSGGVPTFVNTAAWEAQEHISTDIEYYISTNDSYDPTTANTDLEAQGYSDGDEFFIVSRDTTYQVISTGGNLALQFILTNRDSLATLDGGQSVLDDILDNTAAIEANTQHNHEQDARIAALENQDFTTTISSFTESTTLSSFFTSGTIINKGNAGNNLYQAWTVTREGHELIGYLQLTDTERDSFRNEFSLVQGSSSNIYIPANPDAPHTIGIKAFPAADFNDLSSSTQVMLGQISSMRFGGNVGSETMFEIRWELINYSDAIDTGLGTVDSGEIYGAAGDKRYAFLASTLYTAPTWEFREATVSRTEVVVTGGSTVRVDGVEVNDPNFVDNGISTTTARGVAFGADAQGNIIGQVDVTGLSGMGESALSGNTVGSLVKVNATQDGFDDAVAGTDYQTPLTADVDYQTPLAAGVDYQTPIQASDIEGVATDVVVNTWSIEQVENLDTMLTALAITDPSNIGLFVNGQAYRIGDNFVEANTLYRVLSAGAYASFDAIIVANAATAIGTFTINQTNNTFNSVTFTATVTDDAGTSVNLSNISYDIPTTTITVTGTTESGGGGVISSLTIDIGAAARAAVAGTPINLSATSTVNDSIIITQELVDVAVDTGDFVIVDNVLQINNGITSPGFVSFVRVNGFLGVRQEASDDTRDIYIVSYRGATHTVYFFKADSTWRSSDSTADNTNIITPLIGG